MFFFENRFFVSSWRKCGFWALCVSFGVFFDTEKVIIMCPLHIQETGHRLGPVPAWFLNIQMPLTLLAQKTFQYLKVPVFSIVSVKMSF